MFLCCATIEDNYKTRTPLGVCYPQVYTMLIYHVLYEEMLQTKKDYLNNKNKVNIWNENIQKKKMLKMLKYRVTRRCTRNGNWIQTK